MTTVARRKPKASSGVTPKPKKGPLTLPCGCDSTGHRCPGEERLGDALDAALAAFQASGRQPGEPEFPAAYRPLLGARQAYHAHFRLVYDPHSDPLLLEHRCRQTEPS